MHHPVRLCINHPDLPMRSLYPANAGQGPPVLLTLSEENAYKQ